MILSKKSIFACGLLTGLALFSALPVSTALTAEQGGFTPANTGGYTGPSPNAMTVMQAKEQADDTWLTLKGHIINFLGDEKYTFQDSTGQAIIDIDDDVWGGMSFSESDLVEILVEVDKDWGNVEFDAARVVKVQ